MYNYVMLIGRLAKDVEIQAVGEKEKTVLTIACQREFKNPDGNYDTDFINVTVWGPLANIAKEHFHKGDALSVKGRLTQGQNGMCNVVGDRVLLISRTQWNEEAE